MARTLTLLVAVSLMLSFPLALAEEDQDHPPEEATWGLCTAEEENQDGDEASNGTVSSTPPFNQTSEEDCEQTKHPSNQTRDRANETRPGPEDHPDDEDNRGEDERSEERNQTASDDRSEDEQSDDPSEDRSDGEDRRDENRSDDRGNNGSD